MRAFHMSWFAFFLCFFAWFGIAPLMGVVRDEMGLSKEQIGWCIIGSVSITVIARLVIGWLCDRIGPRLAYTWLLTLGSLPVMGIAFSYDYNSFFWCRVAIGIIGAAFVITQYHSSLMFAPSCIGTANATTAGWGNSGGGVTQFAMPALFTLLVSSFGLSPYWGWRASMILAGLLCFFTGIAYYFLTQDTPEGNFSELRAQGKITQEKKSQGTFLAACADYRVWSLFIIYGSCFGIELTINNIAVFYFVDYFDYFKEMNVLKATAMAGLFASAFGLTNIFARTLGGYLSDKIGKKWGLSGRVKWLFVVLFLEGLALIVFSQMNVLLLALPAMILFSLCVQMSSGATFSVVPFINKKALGSVSGIVGAGGNVGAIAAGFLFKTTAFDWHVALLILGMVVTAVSFLSFSIRFSEDAQFEAQVDLHEAITIRNEEAVERKSELVGVGN